MAYVVWRMGHGVYSTAYGVWGMVYGVWGMAYGVCGTAYGVWGTAYGEWGVDMVVVYYYLWLLLCLQTSSRCSVQALVRSQSRYIICAFRSFVDVNFSNTDVIANVDKILQYGIILYGLL